MQWYEQWFLEVVNEGATTLCYVQAEAEFRRQGVIVAEHFGYAQAPAYQTAGLTLSVPCLAEGERGVVFSNAVEPEDYEAHTVDELVVVFRSIVPSSASHHPRTPNVTGSVAASRVTGIVTATGSIYNLAMYVYPSSGGLLFERFALYHLDTLSTGSTWAYETNAAGSSFASYRQYITFIDGVAPFIDGPMSADAVRFSELAELQRAREAELAENVATALASRDSPRLGGR